MSEETKKEWKVGDELAVCRGREYQIHAITKISRTGRLTLGDDLYVLNPNLTVRGLDTWSIVNHSAYEVTDKIRADIAREKKLKVVYRIFRDVSPSCFENDELDQIVVLCKNALERQQETCSQK